MKNLPNMQMLYVATEDGSSGTKGNVLNAIQEKTLEADVIFACGPTPMLRALKEYAAANRYYLLDFYGRKNGMRNRCLSGMCLQIKRYRCTFPGT